MLFSRIITWLANCCID